MRCNIRIRHARAQKEYCLVLHSLYACLSYRCLKFTPKAHYTIINIYRAHFHGRVKKKKRKEKLEKKEKEKVRPWEAFLYGKCEVWAGPASLFGHCGEWVQRASRVFAISTWIVTTIDGGFFSTSIAFLIGRPLLTSSPPAIVWWVPSVFCYWKKKKSLCYNLILNKHISFDTRIKKQWKPWESGC